MCQTLGDLGAKCRRFYSYFRRLKNDDELEKPNRFWILSNRPRTERRHGDWVEHV